MFTPCFVMIELFGESYPSKVPIRAPAHSWWSRLLSGCAGVCSGGVNQRRFGPTGSTKPSSWAINRFHFVKKVATIVPVTGKRSA